MEITDFFRGRRSWKQFWVLFEDLPAHSRTKSKVLTNHEVAAYEVGSLSNEEIRQSILNQGTEPEAEDPGPSLRGYTPLMSKMDDVIDHLIVSRESMARMFGKKDKTKLKLTKRPRTAYQIELEKRQLEFEKNAYEDTLAALGF